jgi:hypothetical protein
MLTRYEERILYKRQKNTEECRLDRAEKFKIDKENLEASLSMVEFQIERNLCPKVIKKRIKVKEKILQMINKNAS